MIENLNGFKNNPEDRHNNPEDCEMGFACYEIINPNKEYNYPKDKQNNIDKHSL